MSKGWIATKNEVGCRAGAGVDILGSAVPARPIAGTSSGVLEDISQGEGGLHASSCRLHGKRKTCWCRQVTLSPVPISSDLVADLLACILIMMVFCEAFDAYHAVEKA